jgi:hypothetical protein
MGTDMMFSVIQLGNLILVGEKKRHRFVLREMGRFF